MMRSPARCRCVREAALTRPNRQVEAYVNDRVWSVTRPCCACPFATRPRAILQSARLPLL